MSMVPDAVDGGRKRALRLDKGRCDDLLTPSFSLRMTRCAAASLCGTDTSLIGQGMNLAYLVTVFLVSAILGRTNVLQIFISRPPDGTNPMNPATDRFAAVLRRGLAIALVVSQAPFAGAQEILGTQRRQASRAELEQAVSGAEAVSASSDPKTREKLAAHVAALRQRLHNGDFVPGDRMYLTVLGDSSLTDTFTVKHDQRLQLPNIPEISLRGVLDSELSSHLSKELARYLKEPQVTAKGLIRLQVMGGIGRPGFMTVPNDQLVTDVIMAAGGPSQSGKFDDAIVKRGSKTFLEKKQFAEAVRTGRSVGDVSLRDGDEIFIPMALTSNRLSTWMPVLSVVTTIFFIARGGRNRNTT